MFTNIIPRCAIVGFVEGRAHNGNPKLDPVNFQHHNVRKITINAAGQNYPSVAYNFNWDTEKPPVNFVRGCVDMMNASMTQHNLTVHVKFNEKLEKGVNIIFLGEFDQILTVYSTHTHV